MKTIPTTPASLHGTRPHAGLSGYPLAGRVMSAVDPLTADGIHEPVSLREMSRDTLEAHIVYLRRENAQLTDDLIEAVGEITRLQRKLTEICGRAV